MNDDVTLRLISWTDVLAASQKVKSIIIKGGCEDVLFAAEHLEVSIRASQTYSVICRDYYYYYILRVDTDIGGPCSLEGPTTVSG